MAWQRAVEDMLLLIPSIAVGRAKALQHMFATLMRESWMPKIPVYLDSPMAITASDVYCRYSTQHRLSRDQRHNMCEALFCRGRW